MTPRTFIRSSRPLVAAALVLATAGIAAANHYPRVPRAVEKRDARVADALSRLIWADSTGMTVDLGQCDCVEPTCDDGTVMVGCGGEVVELYGGFLNTVRRTSRGTCLVCGCAVATPIELRATPVCAGL